jgi:hypothetical protein
MAMLQTLTLLRESQQGPLRLLPGGLARLAAVAFEAGSDLRPYSAQAAAEQPSTSGSGSSTAQQHLHQHQHQHQRRRPQKQQQQQRKAAAPGAPLPWGHVAADDLPVQYSLRPSVLSPLHPVYRENQAVLKRAEFVDLCLTAQDKLSQEIDTTSEEEVRTVFASAGA